MKLSRTISSARRQAGILLTECLVYISVFALLLGIGTAAFYFCWDHTRSVIFATEDITSALRAGEHWRADVRAATGQISVATNANGEVVRIPQTGREIIYRFAAGELRREISTSPNSQLVLAKVNASQMTADARGNVNAWRWELQLTERRKEGHLPMLFTFAAVPAKP